MKTLAVLAASFVALSAPGWAQQTPAMPAPKPEAQQDVFLTADANGNGTLSIEEVLKLDAKATQADFDRYDTDKSKSLTRAEFGKWTADVKAAKAAPTGG